MPQTAGFTPAAATEAASKQGSRLWPMTPTKTKQHSRVATTLSRATNLDKTRVDTGRAGRNTTGGKTAQARDAKGRFAKLQTKQEVLKAEIEVAKMKTQRAQLTKDIMKLEQALEEASPEWSTAQKKNNLRALSRIAKDFDWLAVMVRKAKMKIEQGSRSQREWAKRELPKFEERKREASEARVALGELNTNAKLTENTVAHIEAKAEQHWKKVYVGVAAVTRIERKKTRTQAMLKFALQECRRLREHRAIAGCMCVWRRWHHGRVLRDYTRVVKRASVIKPEAQVDAKITRQPRDDFPEAAAAAQSKLEAHATLPAHGTEPQSRSEPISNKENTMASIETVQSEASDDEYDEEECLRCGVTFLTQYDSMCGACIKAEADDEAFMATLTPMAALAFKKDRREKSHYYKIAQSEIASQR